MLAHWREEERIDKEAIKAKDYKKNISHILQKGVQKKSGVQIKISEKCLNALKILQSEMKMTKRQYLEYHILRDLEALYKSKLANK